MSNPAGLSEVRETWRIVLKGLLAELKATYPGKNIISTENDFRVAFESLPDELHNQNADGNTAFFSRYHVQILFFVQTLDDSVGLEPTESLRTVFWTTALAAIEVRLPLHRSDSR